METTREEGYPNSQTPLATVGSSSTSSPSDVPAGGVPVARYGDGDSLEAITHDQRRAIFEQLAQRLVDDALDDALEHYLRRELQQTAVETVREALAAAGAGGTKRAKSDHIEQVAESGKESAGQNDGLVDDEMSGGAIGQDGGGNEGREESPLADDEADGEEADYTLTVQDAGTLLSGSEQDDPLGHSASPSRLDGLDIFQDLSEMSNFADRIDSILEQTVSEHSTRSGRMRSMSPMPQFVSEYQQQEHEHGDDEVD